nr:MBG domain-containing protein [uncultured Cohaesibacter sp.]
MPIEIACKRRDARRNRGASKPLLAVFMASTALMAPAAYAADILPSGASVSSGSVSIGQSGASMTVTQGSDKAIVNWNSFSIGQNSSVQFVQPSKTSAILNRVTGATGSSIAGSLTANGQVYLINPNGIAITSTGTVNVGGGFVASTLDIVDEDFLSDNLTFSGSGSSAGVSNDGVITIGRGGYAALMGGTVKNDGLIAVPMGKIGLGSGEQATLDLSGDGFLQVAVPTADGAEDDGALVESGGTLSANGGTVVMKAATARNAARQAINMSGLVEAKTISGHNGAITFGGGAGGKVKVTGKVVASAQKGKGGSVTITGDAIDLEGASIDASGAAGGGTINIGGLKHGADGLQTASTMTIDETTTINANATEDGNGGDVVVWSNDLTSYAGTITAIGAGIGAGGDAEVSGKALLEFSGNVDLSSESGTYGTLLLDPANVIIGDTSSGSRSVSSNSDPVVITAFSDTTYISVSSVETLLGSSNLLIEGSSISSSEGNITVASDISWSADTTLTLSAANDIYINADITASGDAAGLVLTTTAGDYSIQSGSSITLSGANASLTINGANYTLIHSMEELDDIDTTGLSGYYALAEDLDASGTTYNKAVVGTSSSSAFSGTFTGLGHTISNLTIKAGSSDYIGLFGYSTGTISNIGLLDAYVSGDDYLGTLVGYSTGAVSYSYATGTALGDDNSGGLIGYAEGSVSNSHADVTVGSSIYGGMNVGGLVGLSFATITSSYATGEVTGNTAVAGLVGDLEQASISNSYATGNVNAKYWAGGLVGYVYDGSISYTYATGNVEGTSYVGGLIGWMVSSTLSNSYASGAVSGTNYVGGISGMAYTSTITTSYWDEETTGQSSAVGDNTSSSVGATALTTAKARTSAGYSSYNWDFDTVWYQTGDMRPILRSEASEASAGVITVSNLHQLALVGADLTASYVLIDDIDASETDAEDSDAGIWGSEGFIPLGSSSSSFSGTIDGDGHTISDLTIHAGSSDYIGLFGYSSGTITNIGLIDAYVGGTGNGVGALVGYSSGLVSNSHASGRVEGSDYVGGLVGVSVGDVSNSYAMASVYGDDYIGGLVGKLKGTITSSYASGDVSATYYMYVGGLVGLADTNSVISNSYASGDVSATNYAGGLVGKANSSTIEYSYATGQVESTQLMGGLGGLVGLAAGVTIRNSFWNKTTTEQSTAAGKISTASTIDATGLTTTQFQNTATFMALATDWDFDNVWAPPSDGYYPELYAVTPVVWFEGLNIKSAYGESSATVSSIVSAGGTDTYVFGDSDDSLTLNSDTFSVDPTTSVGTTTSDMTTSNSTVQSSNGVAYRVFTYGAINRTVTARAITITADDFSRTYGNTNGTLTYTVGGSGLVNGDSLTGTLTTTAVSSSSVGDYAISQGTLSASSNYDVTYTAGTLSVTARAITITADDLSRTYGDTNGSLSYKLGGDGLVNDDSLTGSLATTADSTSDVGTYSITQGTLAASSNYAVTYTAGTLSVTARAITITADDLSRTYGDSNGTLTYTVGGSGLANSDTLTGALTTTADTTSDVGTYAITQGTLAASSNYSITAFTAGTLTVTARAITITADDDSRTYGDSNGTFTYNVGGSGLVNGDSLTGALATTADTTTDVGTFAITQGTLAASSNYNITAFTAGTLTVTARAITITADDDSRTYGDSNGTFTYNVGGSGLVNGDSLTGALTTTADTTSNVGTYAITQGTLSASSNYAISYKSGTLTVTARAITITADDDSRTYGDSNGTFTYKVGGSGFVNGDGLTGALTSVGVTADVGTYAITQGTLTASSNYAISYNAGTLTITARAITITADDLSRIYGDDNGLLTYSVGGSGLANGDRLTGALTSAGGEADVGTYAITQGTLSASNNYAVSYNAGTLTITQRAITITANDLRRSYGNNNGTLTYRVGGFGLVNGDVLKGVLATEAHAMSEVGTYAITQGTLAASSNYTVTYEAGTLTVNRIVPANSAASLVELIVPPLGSAERQRQGPKEASPIQQEQGDIEIEDAGAFLCLISNGCARGL